jgi:hypothetical protein
MLATLLALISGFALETHLLLTGVEPASEFLDGLLM